MMLDKDIKFFRTNRLKIAEKFPGKYVVIKGQKLIGVYNSHKEAYEATTQTHEVGSFIIEAADLPPGTKIV